MCDLRRISFVLVIAAAGGLTEARAESLMTEWSPVIIDATIRDAPAPTIGTHVMSTVFTCAYEAWAAYSPVAVGLYTANDFDVAGGTDADREEAISHALYTVLSEWTPSSQTEIDAFMSNLGYDPEADTEAAVLGRSVAQVVMDARTNDGSNRAGGYADTTGYAPQDPPTPTSWQPVVFNGVAQRGLTPHWGLITPFALTSASQFRPPPPADYGTAEFDQQVMEILDFSARLTDTQKAITEYWLPRRGTPPMLWAQLTAQVSALKGYGLEEDVKLFFAFHNAMLDATIACWEAKYHYDYVRPITAIRDIGDVTVTAWLGPGLGTGELLASEWFPYQGRGSANAMTPPFPEYVSGHSSFGGAWAEVMNAFTGANNFGGSAVVTNLVFDGNRTLDTPVYLYWPTFTGAAEEAAMSRIFGGIHWYDGCVNGIEMGRRVGREAWVKSIQLFNGFGVYDPRCDINEDGVVDHADLMMLTSNWKARLN